MEQKQFTVDALEQHPEIHTVWLSEESRIASFHSVSGFKKHDFSNHSYFMAFLHSLQERGYRFQ